MFRRLFNLQNPAILLGVVFLVSGLIGAAFRRSFNDNIIVGLVFLVPAWIYVLTRGGKDGGSGKDGRAD